MKEIISFIEFQAGRDDYNFDEFTQTMNNLYFLYIRKFIKSIKRSYEMKICKDIMRLKNGLNHSTIKDVNFSTIFINDNDTIKKYKNRVKLKPHEITEIEDSVLIPNRYYLDAVMISEILKKEVNKERFRWFFTILLTGIITLLGIIIKIMGDIYVKLI